MVALTQKNDSAAQQVKAMKAEVKSLERSASLHEAERLMVDAPNRVALYREVEVHANLKRIFYFSQRVARWPFQPTHTLRSRSGGWSLHITDR